ncbi:hypothetical protein KKE26_02820 [bacterium]|nr:hypothetical protein [bacterium]MBU1753902.1 hypothetical protein [bacterium]
MQKLFLSCLMVSIMAMPALAELNYPNIDVKGNLRFKSITANDYDCNKNVQDKEDNVQLTAYLKLSAELADKVGLKAVLKNVSAQGVTNSNDTLNTVLSQTTVYHIYFNVKDIAGVDAVIGRQNIGEKKNALVYQASSADAIKLSTKVGPVDVTLVSANGPADRDTLNAYMLGGKIGEVNVAVANYVRQTSAASADAVLDVTVSGKIPVGCGINASLECAMQSGGKQNGSTVENNATAILAKLGYDGFDMAVGKASCGLTILNTTGDKSSADKNENYTGIKPSLKLTEIVSDIAADSKNDDRSYSTTAIGNRNAIVLNLGLAPAAVAGLNLGLAYGKYKLNEGTEKNYATEINLTAGYKASDAVSLSLLIAQMDPGKVLAPLTDKATKIQAGMKIAF